MNDNIVKQFEMYTSQFLQTTDEFTKKGVQLKIKHTHKVLVLMAALCDDIGLSADDKDLAMIIALLHDIGRFEQLKRYQTFDDSVYNHASVGVDIIADLGLLANRSSEDQRIILTTIFYHNKKDTAIPELGKRELLFTKLIRDADKLDIMRIQLERFNDSLEHARMEKLAICNRSSQWSDKAVKSILASECVDKKDVKTMIDRNLMILSWLFDTNFLFSYKYMQEHSFVDALLAHLPENEMFAKVKIHIRNFMKEQCVKNVIKA